MYIKNPFNEDKEITGANGRRVIRRRHLIYYLRVWDLEADKVLGHIVYITTEGIMLISDQQIPINKEYHLEVRWQDMEGDSKKIAFKAESRWEKKDVNTSFYDTGFELLDEAEDVLNPIRDLIDEYGFND